MKIVNHPQKGVAKNVKMTVVSAVTLQHTREVLVQRDSMCVLSVEKPLVRVPTSLCMSESTQERSLISVRNVEKPSVIAPTLWSIGEFTQD